MTSRICIAALLAALTFSASARADAGSPDSSFNGTGVLQIDTTGLQFETGVAVQADGRLIVTAAGTNFNFARIHRLNDNGSPDGTFGDQGTVTIDGTGPDNLFAVLVQPDGKILVGGSANHAAVLYRFTAGGAPDQGFGTGGRVTLPALTANAADEFVFDIALRDGKIVAVGRSTGATSKGAVWKRNAVDGSADGQRTIVLGDSDSANAVAIQPDSRIVVAGSTNTGSNAFVSRLNTDLNFDPTFHGGTVPLDNGQLETAASVAVQPDGRIVVAGRTTANVNAVGDIMVNRLTTGGDPDQSFNGSGKKIVDSATDEFASKVLVQPDGKLVIVGSAGSDVAFYRLTSAGAFDATFDGDGGRGVDAGGSDTSSDAVLQSDGKIVSVGSGFGVGIVVRVLGDPIPLTVAKGGTGKGAVVSDPIGLNCGVKCTAAFDTGTQVTLTAVPNPGSRFTGWTGCAATGATCRIDLRAPVTVTASFTADVITNPGGGGTTGGGTTGGGTTGPGGGGAKPADTTAPTIAGAALSATRFRVSARKTVVAAAVKRGTSVRYTLSEDAATTIAIVKRTRTLITLKRAKTTKGANLVAFTGRTAKAKLKPGRYKLVLAATDAAGNRSRPVTLAFTVLSGR